MAGGYGTRLREITEDIIPKPMVEINGKPLIKWQIEKLKENGIDDIIVIVGHLKERIIAALGDTVRYYEEKEPLGTAGALPEIEHMLNEEFFVIYGDIFFDVNFKKMIKFHHDHGAEATIFVHPSSHMFDSDLIEFDTNYRIKKIRFKGYPKIEWEHNYTNAGIYLFNKTILNKFPKLPKVDLDKHVLPRLYFLYGYLSPEYVKDVGTLERYYEVDEEVRRGLPEKRNLKNKQKAIFLDRDGTINNYVGLVSHPAQLSLLPKVADAIRLINKSEYLAIVITNQPVVARGLCSIEDVDLIHAKMEEMLGAEGAYVNDIFFCPHHPDKGYPEENPLYKIECECRKPKPGMINAAAKRYNIDLSKSWMIGDTKVDFLTAVNAGVRPIITDDLLKAVRRILYD